MRKGSRRAAVREYKIIPSETSPATGAEKIFITGKKASSVIPSPASDPRSPACGMWRRTQSPKNESTILKMPMIMSVAMPTCQVSTASFVSR